MAPGSRALGMIAEGIFAVCDGGMSVGCQIMSHGSDELDIYWLMSRVASQ